jgi:hypothetical protein
MNILLNKHSKMEVIIRNFLFYFIVLTQLSFTFRLDHKLQRMIHLLLFTYYSQQFQK